jgi:hypothetical protein
MKGEVGLRLLAVLVLRPLLLVIITLNMQHMMINVGPGGHPGGKVVNRPGVVLLLQMAAQGLGRTND